MTEREEEGILIPIEWGSPVEGMSPYATSLLVQHGEHEFILLFFQALPPVVLGTPEERKAQLEEVGSVRAECVAHVIVAADKMPDIIRVLQANLDRYRSKLESE